MYRGVAASQIDIHQSRLGLLHRDQGAIHDPGATAKRLLPRENKPLHAQHIVRSLSGPNAIQRAPFRIMSRLGENSDRIPMRLHQSRDREVLTPHLKQSPMPIRGLSAAR